MLRGSSAFFKKKVGEVGLAVVNNATPKFRALDLGINHTESPEFRRSYKEKREKFDFSKHKMNEKGQLYLIQEHLESSAKPKP